MGIDNPTHEDTIECDINGETMEVGGADLFAEGTTDEHICAVTEDTINAEAADRAREQEELNRLMQDPDFAG